MDYGAPQQQLELLRGCCAGAEPALTPAHYRILQDVAATGAYVHPWELLRALCATRLVQVAGAYHVGERRAAAGGGAAAPPAWPQPRVYEPRSPVLGGSAGEPLDGDGDGGGSSSQRALALSVRTFAARLANLVAMLLDPARRAPPFTLQRLAEVLLTPRRYFKVSAKLFNALERLLALTGAEVGLPQGQPPPPQQQQQLLLRQHPAYATLPDAGLTRQQFEAALADAAHPMLGLDDASGSIDMTRVATMEPELDLGGDGQFDNDSGEGDAQLGCDGGGASSGGRLPAESPLSGFYSGDGAPAESVTAAASRLSAGTMGVSLVVDQTPSASHALGLAAAAAAAAAAEEEDGAGEGGQQVVTPPTATAAGGGASLLVSFDGQPPSIASPPPAASLAGASAVSRAAPSAAAAAAAAPAAAPRLPSDPMRALLEAYLDADDDDDDDDGGGGGGSGDAGEASRLAQRQLQQPQALPAPGPREGGAAAGAFDASQFLAAPDSAATLDARAGDTASSAAVAAGSPRRAAPPAGSPPPPPPAVSSALLMAKSPPGGGTSVGVASVLQQPAAANALLAGRLAAAPPSCPPVFAGVGAPGASQMPQAPPLAGDGAAMVDATAAGAAAHHDTPAGSGAAAVSTPGGQLGAAPAAAGPGAAAGAAARAPPPAGVEEAGDGVAAPSPSKRRRLGSAEDAATGGECST